MDFIFYDEFNAMISSIAMIFGYAESAKLSWLIFKTEEPCVDKRSALQSLALWLYECYLEESKKHYKNCECNKDLKTNYCPTCGQKNQIIEFDVEHVSHYFKSHQSLEAHEFSFYDDLWDVYSFSFKDPVETIFAIPESAEKYLLSALREVKPELF